LTEIPEHLLARSKARRAAMGGGGDDAPAASSTEVAATESAAPVKAASTPAPAAAAATPATVAEPEPTPPWVEAAQRRKKIPLWAVPVLFFLPLWAVVYALTLDPPTQTDGPLTIGDEVYNGKGCSGCHGASGGGAGNIPALIGETAATTVFPEPALMVAWIALGSEGFLRAGINQLPNGMAVGGGMPAWETSLTAEELMAVVLHVRTGLNGEEFEAELWEENWDETVGKLVPDKSEEYLAVLEEWAADPPTEG
jgi:mono/diheme cytochrome c family protein